jgi:spore cortex formation protein SpoVR/YcgB (stage V sporulation)
MPARRRSTARTGSLAGGRVRMLPQGSEWTFDALRQYDAALAHLAERHRLDLYPHQIEIITAEQMLDAYASIGMPVLYHHWSFGKHYLVHAKQYQRGQMGLAYEIVINANPCIAYLMEENTLTMQALVIAHAAYGHNAFFKGNHLFRTWTQADAIIDYLVFARNFIAECEERHGVAAVEALLDACHALMNVGVDRYRHPAKLSLEKERQRQREREAYLQQQVNELWRTLPQARGRQASPQPPRFPEEPEENLLYFIEKHAPLLEPWQREVVRIVRKVAQYFYPQRQTQVMNEGWATWWHHHLLHGLYEDGLVGDGFMLEALHIHTNVVTQRPYHHPHYDGLNPYALGYALWSDIYRICTAPTAEDREWFPDWAGSDWQETFDFAMRNFKDESFIAQYLSPKVMRDFRLFAAVDDDSQPRVRIEAIHNEQGYRRLRNWLAQQYDLGVREPDIQVWNVDTRGNRTLTLRHQMRDRHPLADSAEAVLRHVAALWGFPVRLESVDDKGQVRQTREHAPQRA